MDPKKLFIDDRLVGMCAFCGSASNTRDHVPSKVFLNEPYPDNLPVVDACFECNNSFSLDEEYLACFLECVIAGGTNNEKVSKKVRKILEHNPKLENMISTSAVTCDNGSHGP